MKIQSGFNPWVRNIPWRRKWQLTPGFLPGESHGQRSLVGYSPQDRKESDTTERLSDFTFTFTPSQAVLDQAGADPLTPPSGQRPPLKAQDWKTWR